MLDDETLDEQKETGEGKKKIKFHQNPFSTLDESKYIDTLSKYVRRIKYHFVNLTFLYGEFINPNYHEKTLRFTDPTGSEKWDHTKKRR